MRKLLIPLLAALALPTAVNADDYKYYLLIYVQGSNWKVPMKTKSACEKALQKALDGDNYQFTNRVMKPKAGYGICLLSE